MKSQEMSICLWFDDQAEEAVNFYASVFQMTKFDIEKLRQAYEGE